MYIRLPMDAIDRVVMNARLHYLGSAARIVEPILHLAVLTCMDARLDPATFAGYVYRDPSGFDVYVAQSDVARCDVAWNTADPGTSLSRGTPGKSFGSS